ncbi:MAG TPA: Mur ligase family protein, partial [Longimicrobiales bacterium]
MSRYGVLFGLHGLSSGDASGRTPSEGGSGRVGEWGMAASGSSRNGASDTTQPQGKGSVEGANVPPSPTLPLSHSAVDAPHDIVALSSKGAPIHFVGISGSGMSALAEMVLRAGGRVTGCDANPGEVGEHLRELGAEVVQGHEPSHVEGAAAVVATAAVPQDLPELRAARARGIPVMKRAQALGAIVNRGRLAAVAGTHGKTTTTAMTTEILAAAGLEPTGFVGGRVRGWGGGLRAGRDDLFVVEADEYDRSFLRLRPEAVVVTAVEADHLDVYGSMEQVENAFLQFVELLPEDGLVVACADDPGAARLLQRASGRSLLSYGTGPEARLRAVQVELQPRGSRFRIVESGEQLGIVELALPGIHNVRNALGAFALARRFGGTFEAAQEAL